MNIAEIGLIIIAIAWIFQLVVSWKGNKEISPYFILGYMVGVGILIVSGYLAKIDVSFFEVFTFIAAGVVLARLLTVKPSKAKDVEASKPAMKTSSKTSSKKRI